MHVCECNLSHTIAYTAGLKGWNKGLREYYLHWSRLFQVGTLSLTHTHTQTDAGLKGVTGGSDRILSALVRARQLDMQNHTQAHTHGVSPLMRCVFLIRTQPLEAITRVILNFNGEIMDLEGGRERQRDSEEGGESKGSERRRKKKEETMTKRRAATASERVE